MKKSRYTARPIAFVWRQANIGTPVADVIPKMGISGVTFYRWKLDQLHGKAYNKSACVNTTNFWMPRGGFNYGLDSGN